MESKDLGDLLGGIRNKKSMESKELCKLLKEIRISSYISLPVIKNIEEKDISHGFCNICGNEFLNGRVFESEGKEVHACSQCAEIAEPKGAKQVVKNFKINYKTLDDYFSNENTKNRLVERINKAIAFAKGEDLKGKSIMLGSIAPYLGKSTGPLVWVHEVLGHWLAAEMVFDTSNMDITLNIHAFDNFMAFLEEPSIGTFLEWIGGYPEQDALILQGSHELSDFGELIGQRASYGLLAAAGVGVEAWIFCPALFAIGYALRKRGIGQGLMAFSTVWWSSPMVYCIRGIFDNMLETASAARWFGIHPATFTAIIAAPMLATMGLAYLRSKLKKRKEERRDWLNSLINNGEISPDEILESFKNYDKNLEINSLEKEIADRAEWLFYCEKKEQNKVEKKIHGIAKKMLEKYIHFTDFLAKESKDKIKEHNRKYKEKIKKYSQEDYISFKNELSYLGVPEKKIKKLYNMLHKSSSYKDFCKKKKKYEVAEKFMKKAGLSTEIIPLDNVVSALWNFYEKGPLHFR